MSKTLKELEQTILKAQQQIEELKAAGLAAKSWPQKNDDYYVITSDGSIDYYIWGNSKEGQDRKAMGNIYRGRIEAQREIDRRKLIVELNEFADFTPDWTDVDQSKFILYYDHGDARWDFARWTTHQHISSVHFPTSERAKEAIKHFGNRLDLLL